MLGQLYELLNTPISGQLLATILTLKHFCLTETLNIHGAPELLNYYKGLPY